jgi:hypothetical protein
MNGVPLATFHEVEPARQLQQRLQQAGFVASVTDDSNVERFWLMSRPRAAIHVEVNPKEFLRARRAVEEWHQKDGVLARAVVCPQCQSSRVEYPQFTRKFFTPRLGSLLCAIGMLRRGYYCCDCQFTWPPRHALSQSGMTWDGLQNPSSGTRNSRSPLA